jgi:hypothetical protein
MTQIIDSDSNGDPPSRWIACLSGRNHPAWEMLAGARLMQGASVGAPVTAGTVHGTAHPMLHPMPDMQPRECSA